MSPVSSVDTAVLYTVPAKTTHLHNTFWVRGDCRVFILVSLTRNELCSTAHSNSTPARSTVACQSHSCTRRDQSTWQHRHVGHGVVGASPLRAVGPPRPRFSDRGHDLSHGPAVRVPDSEWIRAAVRSGPRVPRLARRPAAERLKLVAKQAEGRNRQRVMRRGRRRTSHGVPAERQAAPSGGTGGRRAEAPVDDIKGAGRHQGSPWPESWTGDGADRARTRRS